MDIKLHDNEAELGAAAAGEGVASIHDAIEQRGEARIILATGTSQFTMLEALVAADVDWPKVQAFHLDEYVGIANTHRASFRRYLRERVLSRLPRLGGFDLIVGDSADLPAEVARLNTALSSQPVDVCFAGIGENAHLAFNDPPANFSTSAPYIVVQLDLACRKQQVAEGWFENVEAVPERAISMSISQIMKSKRLILSVPGHRKAEAVRNTVEGSVTPDHPASIVQTHSAVTLHLDRASAAGLSAGAQAALDAGA